MFKKEKKVTFTKSGSGSYTARVLLPAEWLKHLEITKEDNKITLELEEDKIILKKLK
ncbi:AbrB/MazE/SpoVT family DNA-binding domain-containing protein [Clostridium baratii]|uniref:AbrB/MazE/SpoVT family DNA-binding domain-containing protein n=1 Tax=Clostridium baratii TaxID=1561 RepID=UPI0030D0D71C